ncbi:hypothetical protein TcWFU_001204 [Taenia crassiceps]|uniref:Uncharacterized protein n=1 Tax=Taenia crassiceps TaxID=6207 RepID=A0ABR4Q7E9_9CEST
MKQSYRRIPMVTPQLELRQHQATWLRGNYGSSKKRFPSKTRGRYTTKIRCCTSIETKALLSLIHILPVKDLGTFPQVMDN